MLVKTDIELSRGDAADSEAIKNRVTSIQTFGEAEAYAGTSPPKAIYALLLRQRDGRCGESVAGMG